LFCGAKIADRLKLAASSSWSALNQL